MTFRRGCAGVVAVAVVTLMGPSRAGATPPHGDPRVAVLPFEGPGAHRPEQRVRRALDQHVSLVPTDRVSQALGGGDPTDAEGHVALARGLDASALVSGRVLRHGSRWVVEVTVREGATGEVVSQVRWAHAQVGALLARVSRQTWARLGEPLSNAAPPPAPEPPTRAPVRASEPAAEVDGAREAETPTDGGEPSAHADALRLSAGMQIMSRRFRFKDDLFGALAGYDLPAAPAVTLEGEWYPGAHFTDGPWANIGFRLRYVRMFGVQSEPSRSVGAQFDTLFDRVEAGVRGRIPFERAEVNLGVEWGQQRFGVQIPEEAQVRGMPGVRYRFVRFEAGASYRVRDWLRLDLLAGYLHPFAFGELGSEEWFHRMRGGGIDGRLVTAVMLGSGLEARLAAEVRRMFFDMRSEPGDAWVAGGAVDRVWSLGLELGWRY